MKTKSFTTSGDAAEFTRVDGGLVTIKRRTVTSVGQIDGGGSHITRKDGPPLLVTADYAEVLAWWEGAA